jgi:secreted trypsin-like serine protease
VDISVPVSAPGIEVKVESITVHPGYQVVNVTLCRGVASLTSPTQGAIMDIAVLKLASEVEFSHAVRPVCLFSTDPTALHSPADDFRVAGWGAKEDSPFGSDRLLYTILEPVSPASCQAQWGTTLTLLPSQLCASGEDMMDSCNGDSGGPLVAQLDGKWFLSGVVSFGISSCDSSVPAIYTRTSSYFNWLELTMFPGKYILFVKPALSRIPQTWLRNPVPSQLPSAPTQLDTMHWSLLQQDIQ